MLNDKRFGLNVNLLATKVMPTLIPIIVSPNLKIEEVWCYFFLTKKLCFIFSIVFSFVV